ncbi:hypothetical protein EDC04DRAFT_385434 [Pisolithus marmoratus]|nr:hypothetical protein EDC04DRAFT_385434 [Pisolithus marmoratus]
MDVVRQFFLRLSTSLPTIHTTDDFEVVLVQLMERWDWAVAALPQPACKQCPYDRFHARLPCGRTRDAFASCQLTAEQLRILVDVVGPRTFAVVTAVPSFGVIIIPVMHILWISGSPIAAVSLMVAIMVPIVILPLAMLCFQNTRTRRSDDGQA